MNPIRDNSKCSPENLRGIALYYLLYTFLRLFKEFLQSPLNIFSKNVLGVTWISRSSSQQYLKCFSVSQFFSRRFFYFIPEFLKLFQKAFVARHKTKQIMIKLFFQNSKIFIMDCFSNFSKVHIEKFEEMPFSINRHHFSIFLENFIMIGNHPHNYDIVLLESFHVVFCQTSVAIPPDIF